ncbi:hypothetical protein OCGS_1042 [Oceaniovalibus guishaninsula JLT2003]|uniref:Uncharacterized protein n=1 Tax=Oceaniovalibus guishaninsula JLT2003 TaxID=1231392 RepID=K2HEQ8_9RHOB|nr:hypothetical protein [Oceaniovalibus guishaninsula]EKE45007.1 hypothetical protein OCGS_1042 [Oceaniovalibus guishaninsula JLT2003]
MTDPARSHDATSPRPDEDRQAFAEASESLWRITFGPALWALHFAGSYGVAAIWCAKVAAKGQDIAPLRLGFAVVTLAVLAAIGWLGWRSWRQWDYLGDRDYENAGANHEDRHQFLGHAAFLLSIVSFVGVVYTGLPVVFVQACR